MIFLFNRILPTILNQYILLITAHKKFKIPSILVMCDEIAISELQMKVFTENFKQVKSYNFM